MASFSHVLHFFKLQQIGPGQVARATEGGLHTSYHGLNCPDFGFTQLRGFSGQLRNCHMVGGVCGRRNAGLG